MSNYKSHPCPTENGITESETPTCVEASTPSAKPAEVCDPAVSAAASDDATAGVDASQSGADLASMDPTASGDSAAPESPGQDSAGLDSAGLNSTDATSAPEDASGKPADSGGQQLSKNKQRKLRHRERQVAARRARRSEEKQRRRQRDATAQAAAAAAGQLVSKRERRRAELDRLRAARQHGPPVCVDLRFGERMSEKEQSRLATQLGRLYGANRAAARPFRLLLAGLAEDGPLFRRCCRLVDGFERLELERSAGAPHELFPAERLVYLSPDGAAELTELDARDVYVIGGLVDETVQRGVTRAAAAAAGCRTARLPTAAHLSHAAGTRACVLTVNQVFEILLRYRETADWTAALTATVPARKGFTARSDDAVAASDAAPAPGPPPVGAE